MLGIPIEFLFITFCFIFHLASLIFLRLHFQSHMFHSILLVFHICIYRIILVCIVGSFSREIVDFVYFYSIYREYYVEFESKRHETKQYCYIPYICILCNAPAHTQRNAVDYKHHLRNKTKIKVHEIQVFPSKI